MKPIRRTVWIALSILSCAGCDDPQASPVERGDGAQSAVGIQVPNWRARFDDPEVAADAIRFAPTAQGSGYELAVGPNVTLWTPENLATSDYALDAEITHVDSHGNPHGAGLVFGGADLDGPRQRYTYFLVRCDGCYLIKLRDSDSTSTLVPWTEHEAVRPEDEQGVATNTLRVEVGASHTRFVANGAELATFPNELLHTDGYYGYRSVHQLDLRLSPIRLTTAD